MQANRVKNGWTAPKTWPRQMPETLVSPEPPVTPLSTMTLMLDQMSQDNLQRESLMDLLEVQQDELTRLRRKVTKQKEQLVPLQRVVLVAKLIVADDCDAAIHPECWRNFRRAVELAP